MWWLLLAPVFWLLREKFPDLWWAATMPLVNFPTPAKRRSTLEAVLQSREVQDALRTEAERTKHSLRQVQRKAEQYLTALAADHGPITLRIFAYFFRKLVPLLLYSFGIHFTPEQVERAREAAKSGYSLIYIPTHKSHMDYLVLTYICLLNQLPIPHVVAGDNLNFAVVGGILKRCGAVFIRRQFGDDQLYHAVFRSYIRQLAISGQAIECFIESQRSRTGKILMPKVGFLRCITDAVMEEAVKDATIIPVSLGYDRVLENESYTAEAMGASKSPERLRMLLQTFAEYLRRSWQNKLCYGRIHVGIGDPVLVRDYIQHSLQEYRDGQQGSWAEWDPTQLIGHPYTAPESTSSVEMPNGSMQLRRQHPTSQANEVHSSAKRGPPHLQVKVSLSQNGPIDSSGTEPHSPLSGRPVSRLQNFIAKRLAYRCLYECNQVAIVLPGVLVATVLATEPIRGISEADLRKQVETIQYEVEIRGGHVARLDRSLSATIEDVVDKVLGMEKRNHKLVKRHKKFIMLSLWTPPEQLELSMMRNQLIHIFVLEGFVSISMYAAEKGVYPCLVKRQALRDSCLFLMRLLHREFIYRPSHYGNSAAFDKSIDFMVQREILIQQGDDLTVNDSPAADGQGPATYLFLCGLLWPFVESYWLAAICLRRILGGKLISQQTFLQHIQIIGERLFFESHIDLYEAITAPTLQNALALFREWGVLEQVETVGVPAAKHDLIRLAAVYDSEHEVDTLAEKIVKFRKKCRAYRSRRYQQRIGTEAEVGNRLVRSLTLTSLPDV